MIDEETKDSEWEPLFDMEGRSRLDYPHTVTIKRVSEKGVYLYGEDGIELYADVLSWLHPITTDVLIDWTITSPYPGPYTTFLRVAFKDDKAATLFKMFQA